MSVVGEITLLCGWECLLEPVVAWTSTHCFCLIEVLIWPSSDLCVSWPVFEVGEAAAGCKFNGLCVCWAVFGLFIPSTAAPLNHTGNLTRAAGEKYVTVEPADVSLTGSCAGSFTAQSKVVGQCDTRPYLQTSKPGGGMFGSPSKSLLSCLSVLESTTTP